MISEQAREAEDAEAIGKMTQRLAPGEVRFSPHK